MANSSTFKISERRYTTKIGSVRYGYGVKDTDGKWSNYKTLNVLCTYTEVTTLKRCGTVSQTVASPTVSMGTFTIPSSSLGGSLEGGVFAYESSSVTNELRRVTPNGMHEYITTTRTAGTPFVQTTAPTPWSPPSGAILESERTYGVAIGSVSVGYGVYDVDAKKYSNYRQATCIAKFDEKVWVEKLLANGGVDGTANQPCLLCDEYNLVYGATGSLQTATFAYEPTRVESTCVRSAECGWWTRTTTVKTSTGVVVA